MPHPGTPLIQVLGNLPVWLWALASPLCTWLAVTDPGLYAQTWLWSVILTQFPSLHTADLLGVVLPGLNPAILTGTDCLTWGTVGLVHSWKSHGIMLELFKSSSFLRTGMLKLCKHWSFVNCHIYTWICWSFRLFSAPYSQIWYLSSFSLKSQFTVILFLSLCYRLFRSSCINTRSSAGVYFPWHLCHCWMICI